jgi:nitrate reductase delta subunit
MFGSRRKDEFHLRAADRIASETRARFSLEPEAVVLVTQIACGLPGCPPLETVVVFWTAGKRYRFKIFKPMAEVLEQDLPPAWLKQGLAAPEGYDEDCC